MDQKLLILCWYCFFGGFEARLLDPRLCAQTLPSAPAAFGESDPLLESLVDDATLHDVAFVDSEQGWAVGDHGVIWHTSDGGKNWHRQNANVEVALHGVCFANRQLGWAVGGSTRPYLWTSQAVVLRTNDGGQNWRQQLALLPALERVKFFDGDHGLAWGRGSGGDPLGVFASDDSGRNWRSVAVGPRSAWWGGDFINQHTGLVVGPAGKVVQIDSGDATPISPDGVQRSLRDIKHSEGETAWAVGENGLILRSDKSNADWQSVDILPHDVNAAVDWYTLEIHGKHIWIAGSPGTVVLHSADAGQSWQGYATGHNAPLHRIVFVDESHGWAVGEFGTILHTLDGGQSWNAQHQGGERAAVLMLLADEDQLPLETLAKLGSDGYRTVVHLFSEPQVSLNPSRQARLAEALSLVGANAMTQSSFSSPATDKHQKQERLRAEIVRQLRLWRPAVVVVPSAEQPNSWGTWIAETAGQAITQAADGKQFAYLGDQLALEPWQVSRLFALLPQGERGTHRVLGSDAAGLSAKTLAEISTSAWSLLRVGFQPAPETNEFLLKASLAGEPTAAVDDLAAGLSITPGSDCRRPTATLTTTYDPQAQRRLAEKRRNLQNIFRFAEGNPALLGQVGQMIADLDPTAAAALLFELSTYFRQAGQIELAASVMELLARRYPNDPLVDQALVWLVQYYASGETAHAYRPLTTEVAQAAAHQEQGSNQPSPVQRISAIADSEQSSPTNPSLAQLRYGRALQVAEHIAQTRPLLYSEPQVRVPWAMAECKRGTSDGAERYLQSLAIRYPGEAWQECGAAERWLADRTKPAPVKRRILCRFTGTKPNLDGKLEEACWQSKSTELNQSDPPSEIRNQKSEFLFSHDEEYLYLAVRCKRDPRLSYATDNRARGYDADLNDQDRVQLLIDMDRDYTTFYALSVDHRGWTNDACWDDTSWNPKWFVAAGGDSDHWTCEAAIPWSELASTPPTHGDAWAVAGKRLAPGDERNQLGCRPEEFGVLLFK